MFLFFFMVITTIRTSTALVKVIPPKASEIQNLEKKSLVSFIYIGKPLKAALGTESRIQLNDAFASVSNIQAFVVAERQSRNELDRKLLTVSLKVDAATKMGIVSDVKQELRKASAYKINYSTNKKGKIAD